jgi:hypothetical protein
MKRVLIKYEGKAVFEKVTLLLKHMDASFNDVIYDDLTIECNGQMG